VAFQKINSNFTELYTLSEAPPSFIVPQSDVDPVNPEPGRIYYNPLTGKFRGFNGIDQIWQDLN
jgi:hypothetical protein